MQFAKTQSQEKTSQVELSELFKEIKDNLKDDNLEILHENKIFLNARPLALKRSF